MNLRIDLKGTGIPPNCGFIFPFYPAHPTVGTAGLSRPHSGTRKRRVLHSATLKKARLFINLGGIVNAGKPLCAMTFSEDPGLSGLIRVNPANEVFSNHPLSSANLVRISAQLSSLSAVLW
jgi:hypothetical protein